jgi:hypothetical protein
MGTKASHSSFSWAAVCNQQKNFWARGGCGPLWPITGSAVALQQKLTGVYSGDDGV